MSETALHPPEEVYGEYERANGFDESNDGTETPFRETPDELELDEEEPVAAGDTALDDGVERDAVG